MKSIQFKRTNTVGAKPTPEQLEVGEIALQLKDKTIFTKDRDHQVIQLSVSPDTHATLDKKVNDHKKELDQVIVFNDQTINAKVDEIKTVTDGTISENDKAINTKVDTIKRETDAKIEANKNTAASDLVTAKDELTATITANRTEVLTAITTNDKAINQKVDGIKERTDATIEANNTAINEKVDTIKTATDRTITANREHCDTELSRLETRIDHLDGASDGKFIKIHQNTETNGYLLSKTADYTHSEELQDGHYLNYFGAYRMNGQDNWGENAGLLLNVPNASGKEHGRGFAFQYGSAGSKVYTYGFDAVGIKSFSYRIYHEGDKPTPAELGVYSKTETDSKYVSKTTGDYFSETEAERDLSKFGATRTNNTDGFLGLTLNVPHAYATKDNLSHGRGFTFQYGSQGSRVQTYGYDAEGRKAYTYKMYHEGDKPSPSELNVYSKQESDSRYPTKDVVSVDGTGTQNLFKSPNNQHQMVFFNDGTLNVWSPSANRIRFNIHPQGREIKVIGDSDYIGVSLVKGDGRYVRLESNTHSASTFGNLIYREANSNNISVLGLPKENGTLATQAWSTGQFSPKTLYRIGDNGSESWVKTPDQTKVFNIHNTGYSGVYSRAASKYIWRFNESGTLTDGLIPVSNGGTGAKDVTSARNNLQVYSKSEVDSKLSAAGGASVNFWKARHGASTPDYGSSVWKPAKHTITFPAHSRASKVILEIRYDCYGSGTGLTSSSYPVTVTGGTHAVLIDEAPVDNSSSASNSVRWAKRGWTRFVIDIPANSECTFTYGAELKSTNGRGMYAYFTVKGSRLSTTDNYVTL